MQSWSLWAMGIPMATGAVCGGALIATGDSAPALGAVVYSIFGGMFLGMMVGAGAWIGGLIAEPIIDTHIANFRTARRVVFATCSSLSVLAFAWGTTYLLMGPASAGTVRYLGLV